MDPLKYWKDKADPHGIKTALGLGWLYVEAHKDFLLSLSASNGNKDADSPANNLGNKKQIVFYVKDYTDSSNKIQDD